MKKIFTPKKTKIAIIGAGNVGSATAYTLTLKNLAAEIILIDINEKKESGEVWDIDDSLSFVETGSIKGGDFADASDADIIVISAGAGQKPGQTRLDLLAINKKILTSIFKSIGKLQPNTIVVMISNPVDILTHLAQQISKLPTNQVFGTGTTLDTARLRTQVAERLGVSPHSVHGFVLGEHGDSEFISWDSMTIGGIPAKKIPKLNAGTRRAIEKHVRREAYEIINRKGSTFYGIASAVTDIIESILFDQHKILPTTARLTNWNGVSDVCLGAPTVIGRTGVIKTWPLRLNAVEKKQLKKSANTIKSYLKKL